MDTTNHISQGKQTPKLLTQEAVALALNYWYELDSEEIAEIMLGTSSPTLPGEEQRGASKPEGASDNDDFDSYEPSDHDLPSSREATKAHVADLAILRDEVQARLLQLHSLPPEAIHGCARIGRLIQVLRVANGFTLRELAAKTSLPWWWLALLEGGRVLPSELTEHRLETLGQAFPGRAREARPGALFSVLTKALRRLTLPASEKEQQRSLADLLPLAAVGNHLTEIQEGTQKDSSRYYHVTTLTIEGKDYEFFTDAERKVFIRPSPPEGKQKLFLDGEIFALKVVEDEADRWEVTGLTFDHLRRFLKILPAQREIMFNS